MSLDRNVLTFRPYNVVTKLSTICGCYHFVYVIKQNTTIQTFGKYLALALPTISMTKKLEVLVHGYFPGTNFN